MGSNHPAKANALLAEFFCEETFVKIQFKARRCLVVGPLGLVFAQRDGDRMGVEYRFAPGGFCECKPCIVRGGNGILRRRSCIEPDDQTCLGELAYENGRRGQLRCADDWRVRAF